MGRHENNRRDPGRLIISAGAHGNRCSRSRRHAPLVAVNGCSGAALCANKGLVSAFEDGLMLARLNQRDDGGLRHVECSSEELMRRRNDFPVDANFRVARDDDAQRCTHILAQNIECGSALQRTQVPSGPKNRILYHTRPAVVLLTVLVSLIGNFGPLLVESKRIQPSWEWGGQTLYTCNEAHEDRETQCKCYGSSPDVACITTLPKIPEAKTNPGRHRSCTSQPNIQYACKNPLDEIDQGCKCELKCTSFDTGWPAEQGVGSGPLCIDSIFALEDTWSLLNFFFKDWPDPSGDKRTPEDIQDDFRCIEPNGAFKTSDDGALAEHYIKVELRARYGGFNLYDMRQRCEYTPGTVQICDLQRKLEIFSPSIPEDEEDRLESLKFVRDVDLEYSSIEFVGTFRAVYTAMKSLYYKSFANQNSNRLRSRIYNQIASRLQPFEMLYAVISVNDACSSSGPFVPIQNITQFLHIIDVNDPPGISHPADTFSAPFDCTPTSIADKCHFGQFYADEDSSTPVQIGGIQIDDTDVKELCPFSNQECKPIDVNVRAVRGSVALNTRSRLEFYENTREAQGFTAFLTPSNAAVKVIFYRVETVDRLGPNSVVLNFNTQHSGQTEAVRVIVSDQALTGNAGKAEIRTITVDITIVGINDAPVISIDKSEYSIFEDTRTLLDGINVQDGDLNERISSSLARMTWMKPISAQQTLNQMQFRITVVRGILQLGYTTGLRLVDTAPFTFYTIQRYRFGHDTCRLRDVYNDISQLQAAASRLPESERHPSVYKSFKEGICAFFNIGAADCPTGAEPTCVCRESLSSCETDGLITLEVNNTALVFLKPPDALGKRAEDASKRHAWLKMLEKAVENRDRTCGGMPWYPAPNNFSYGLSCQTDADCRSNVLPVCTPGTNCTCCANASHVCSSDSDCSVFDKGSSCGCLLGGPADGVCGPYYLNEGLTLGRTTAYLTRYRNDVNAPKLYGRRCTFAAPFSNQRLPGATSALIRDCLPGAFGVLGSTSQKALDTISLSSDGRRGSKRITFIGALVDVQSALAQIFYETDLNYNRLFRPPKEEQDPTTFDPEADNVDTLTMTTDDLGNSGGKLLDNRMVSKEVKLRVSAVNDKPEARGPFKIDVEEDIPFHFTASTGRALSIFDPDYKDYGFDVKVFTVNISCSHGRLFLNEDFLQMPGVESNRISFRFWGQGQEKRGLHYETKRGIQPRYGNKCQLKPQCSDGVGLKSEDAPYGFFESKKYGLVYSPKFAEFGGKGESQGCGLCPEDTGNKFVSIQGVYNDINEALSFVTYLPDPHFNTRSKDSSGQVRVEEIKFSVNDNGGIGNDEFAPPLTHELLIEVLVESVNDRPIIGRYLPAERYLQLWSQGAEAAQLIDDVSIVDMNKTLDARCAGMPPSGNTYSSVCGPGKRQFIDIDEDGEFYITRDILWIEDVDSDETLQMEEPRRYCCDQVGPLGCKCGQPCTCNNFPCACDTPMVCNASKTPGQLNVHFSVKHGVLQFFPPPGRDFFPEKDLVFLINSTDQSMIKGGPMAPCANQRACMRNVTEINMRGQKRYIQNGLKWMFLTYRPKPDYYGPDELFVWVSDNGYTDECYNASLVATQKIMIRVVGVNDAPKIQKPADVMVYPRGQRCFNDFHDNPSLYSTTGINAECLKYPNSSKIPPGSTGAAVHFSDVDMNDKEYGNLTVRIRVGSDEKEHAKAGSLLFVETTETNDKGIIELSNRWLDVYPDPRTGLFTMRIMSKLEDVNKLMKQLRYDADPTYQGFIPIKIYANDNMNFGECSGVHKCGKEDVCGDHQNAEAHQPVLPGLSEVTLDATIAVLTSCQPTSCDQCVLTPGCGWCPGLCGGRCLSGTEAGPTFETCPPHPQNGTKWNQCEIKKSSPLVIILSVSISVTLFLITFVIFLRWVQRRHGSLKVYVRKKQRDTKRALKRANLLPPDDANYTMYFALQLATSAIIIAMALIRNDRPECKFNTMIYMGGAASIHLKSDACKVRFVPTRNMSYPDNALQAVKVQIAAPVEETILVTYDACGSSAKVEIKNNREEALKYVEYYCNVQLLVPDRFVLPATTIEAVGSNITYVRAGSMDPDSYNFGLRFGPNAFKLKGDNGGFMMARIQNLTATHFEYNVDHGSIIGTHVQAATASIKSEDGDMIMTTTTRTSVKFWQKSNNLACLTAAENSLYVDDACVRVCEFKTADRRSFTHLQEADDINNASRASLREEVFPWMCKPTSDGKKNCEQFDPYTAEEDDNCPVGAPYVKKSQVPQTIGCFNLDACTIIESPQCLCRPKCDMAGLDPPGTCDALGKCCQTICQGYSKADLFPDANQPRCLNSETDWYCNGTLDQQWNFTSTSGQISLEVVKNSNPPKKHSSYRGSAPASKIDTKIDLREADKKTLNHAFHPGGKNQPDQEWFALRLRGPGAPEPSDGEFVWLASTRFLILPGWLMSFLSIGLLRPSKGAALSVMNPAFCPAFVPSSSELFQTRLVDMKKMLKDSVETFPGPDRRDIPVKSVMAYIPIGDVPRSFKVDLGTNKEYANSVRPEHYPLILTTAAMGIVIPAILSTLFMVKVGLSLHKFVKAYRIKKIKQEQFTANLSQLFTKLTDVQDGEYIDGRKKLEMTGRTNLFYLFELCVIGNAESQRSVFSEVLVVLYEIGLVLAPCLFLWFLIDMLSTARLSEKCEFRPDTCSCFAETDIGTTFVTIEKIFLLFSFCISELEMASHYLRLPYNLGRRILRYMFYTLYLLVCWYALTLLIIVSLFVVLGIIVKPTHLAPYGIAIIGTAACCASLWAKKRKYQIRVTRAVIKRVETEKATMKSVPPALMDVLMDRNVQQALHTHGLSVPQAIVAVIVFWLFQAVIYVFIFVGFQAFTDPNNVTTGFINSGIALFVAQSVHYVCAKESSEEDVRDAVEEMTEKVMGDLNQVINMVTRQLVLAMKLYERMKGKVQDVSFGESSSSSEISSSSGDSSK